MANFAETVKRNQVAMRAADPAKFAFLDRYNAVPLAPVSQFVQTERQGVQVANSREIAAYQVSPTGKLKAQLYSEGIAKGYIEKPKKHFLDHVSDFVGYAVEGVTIAGIGAGLAGIAGVGPAAGGGSSQAAAAASDAGYLPPPVSASPVIAATPAAAATVPTAISTTAKSLGVLAGTASSVASAARAFKNTKAADVTPATVPTVRPIVTPGGSNGAAPGASGNGALLLLAALALGVVIT